MNMPTMYRPGPPAQGQPQAQGQGQDQMKAKLDMMSMPAGYDPVSQVSNKQFRNGDPFVNGRGQLRQPYRDMPRQMQTRPAPQQAGGSPPMGAPTTMYAGGSATFDEGGNSRPIEYGYANMINHFGGGGGGNPYGNKMGGFGGFPGKGGMGDGPPMMQHQGSGRGNPIGYGGGMGPGLQVGDGVDLQQNMMGGFGGFPGMGGMGQNLQNMMGGFGGPQGFGGMNPFLRQMMGGGGGNPFMGLRNQFAQNPGPTVGFGSFNPFAPPQFTGDV